MPVVLTFKNMATKHLVNEYPVIVHADQKVGYWDECPIFDGCYSQGKTIDEALKNIQEAIQLCKQEAPKRRRSQLRRSVSLHLVQA